MSYNWQARYATSYKKLSSHDEIEWRKEQDRLAREEEDDLEAKFEREKVAEWESASGKHISLHFDPKDKVIFVWFNHLDLLPFTVSALRRPTDLEHKSKPDLYAILDNGEERVGLTKERYLALRIKLEDIRHE